MKLWRHWGYLVIVVMALGAYGGTAGPTLYLVGVALLAVFLLFAAPVHCGAINRRRGGAIEFCRNNSGGIVLGCHLRQHKFQKFGRYWWTLGWREKSRGIWTGASAKLATVGFLVGTTTGLIGTYDVLFK